VCEPLLQLDPITEGLGKGRRLLHPKRHRATNYFALHEDDDALNEFIDIERKLFNIGFLCEPRTRRITSLARLQSSTIQSTLFKLHTGERGPAWMTRPTEDLNERALTRRRRFVRLQSRFRSARPT
jgi:hypothetical protein